MRPVCTVFCVALAIVLLVGCQGSDPTAPLRDLDLAGKGVGSGKGGDTAAIVLGGGYNSSPGSGGIKAKGRWATFETPFLSPFSSTLNVDTNGGAPGPNQIPLSDQLNWNHCIWNADVASPYDPNVVPQAARDLWDEFFENHASARPRLFFALVDTKADGEASWKHESILRWFTTSGSDKYMWEFEVGAEPNLSLVQPVASWDGQAFTFTEGIVRVTRTFCGSASGPAGCVPARGKGNRPTVVCRNDGLAFPAITYTAQVQ